MVVSLLSRKSTAKSINLIAKRIGQALYVRGVPQSTFVPASIGTTSHAGPGLSLHKGRRVAFVWCATIVATATEARSNLLLTTNTVPQNEQRFDICNYLAKPL